MATKYGIGHIKKKKSMALDDNGWIQVVNSKLKTNSQKASLCIAIQSNLWLIGPRSKIKPLILLLFLGWSGAPIAKIISYTRNIWKVSHMQTGFTVVSHTQVGSTHCGIHQCVSDSTYMPGTPYTSSTHRLDYYELYKYIYIYIYIYFFFEKHELYIYIYIY